MAAEPLEVEWPESIFEHWGKEILQSYGALELAEARPSTLSNAVHPLFAARKWFLFDNDDFKSIPLDPEYGTPLGADDYRLLRPSSRLASHFLAEPYLLPYWHALFFGARVRLPSRDVTNCARGEKGGFYGFTRNYNLYTNSFALSTADILNTLHALRALADMTTIRFGPTEDSLVLAETTRSFRREVAPGFAGTASAMTVNIHLLRALRSRRLTISERLRIQYCLGITLTHEVAHAAHNARTAMLGPPHRNGNYRDEQWVVEAFFENDILAEAGHAWEQNVLNGSQVPFYNNPECKFGIQFEKWPGLHDVPPDVPTRRKPKGWTTVYAMPMRFVQAAFTEEHWESVRKYGVMQVRAPKELGWRLRLDAQYAVDDADEGISWDNSSRGREADEDGVVWPTKGSQEPIDWQEPVDLMDLD